MRSVILLSGGMDSAVLLAERVAEDGAENVVALLVDYGQRHRRELDAADSLCRHYGVRRWETSADLCGGSILEGGEGELTGADTVVPFRNGVLLALGVGLAAHVGAGCVWIGCHSGDRETYPDCRSEFLQAFSECARLAHGIRVCAPFVGLSKRAVVERGRALGVRFELTYSCYLGQPAPCGECGACKERSAALEVLL